MIQAEYKPSNEFVPFPKIKRLFRDILITEKIDGTNGQIYISEDGSIKAASRGRYLTLESDNFGFAKWVHENQEDLLTLGPGRHYGEWYGNGIQRNYNLKEKRFTLFNTSRWSKERPSCCDCVPILYEGMFDQEQVQNCIDLLVSKGSVAVPEFMNPEGIVIYHTQSNHLYKWTFGGDGHKELS